MLCFSFSNENKISSFNKGNFKRILITVLHNNFLSFDGKSWKQIDGVAMGSLLGPSLSNTFLCFNEQILMTYLLYFIHQIFLKNLQIIQILNIEILNHLQKRNQWFTLFFGYFDFKIKEWFEHIWLSETNY